MKTIKQGLLGAAALTLCTLASAQDAYIGVGYGATNLKTDCAGTLTCDNSDRGGKLFGGYKFSPSWAGEVVYLGFGKAKASQRVGTAIVSADIKTSAMGVGVAYLGDWSDTWKGVARLGLARVKAEVSARSGAISASESKNSTQAYMGLGVGYLVTPNVSIDLSADFSRSKVFEETGSIRMLGAGLTFTF